LLYPCYETPEELERRRKIRLSRRLPPVYGREALKLTDEEKAAFEAEGRKPHWRFLLPNFASDPFDTQRTEIHWDDVVRGPQTVDLASMSDPVLIREDGSYLYTLPSVIDDIDLGVTHVIRGDDHVTNTGAQIALFRALGAEAPAFGHHNLLTTTTGEGLSKRSGALSIKALHEAGLRADGRCFFGGSDRHLGSGRGRVFAGGDGGELQSVVEFEIGGEVRSGRIGRTQPSNCPSIAVRSRVRTSRGGRCRC
jgi:glutamyl-tRNA synthetase